MKKLILIASIVGVRFFSVATSIFASNAIHFDYLFSDDADKNFLGSVDNNFSSLPSMKFGFEVFPITVKTKTSSETTLNGYNIKDSFSIINSDDFKLYGTLTCLIFNGDSDTGDAKYRPIMVGMETQIGLGERMFLDGGLDYAAWYKEYERDGLDDADADYMAAKVRLNYLFTDNIGVAAGYTWNQFKVDGVKTELITGINQCRRERPDQEPVSHGSTNARQA
jgi:hypothetical protein